MTAVVRLGTRNRRYDRPALTPPPVCPTVMGLLWVIGVAVWHRPVSQAHLGWAVAKLRGDERGLDRPHDQDGKGEGHHRPENCVHPQRRLEPEFDPKGQADNNRAQHHDDADRSCIAGVGLPEVQPAHGACKPQSQQPLEQLALATSWTPAAQCRLKDRNLWFRHGDGQSRRTTRVRSDPRRTSRCRRTGKATPHRRNANTRPPLRNRSAAPA